MPGAPAGAKPFLQEPDQVGRKPNLRPDYVDVTIPPNVAPMNFVLEEEGASFRVTATSGSNDHSLEVTSSDGAVRFPEDAWRELLAESQGGAITTQVVALNPKGNPEVEFDPFHFFVSRDPIDPWLVYRLIDPGYYGWSEMKIMQRSVESFREETIINNQTLENNCANCHSFNNNSPDRFLIHIRGSRGGTYFYEQGELSRTDPKIDGMPGGATYPAWHPNGRYVAFSSNQVRQSFYSLPGKVVEVYDLVSSLILYDREVNETLLIPQQTEPPFLLTFPSWAPEGDYLYFSKAPLVIDSLNPQVEQIENTHYDIARKAFDPETRAFGETEIVFDATGMNKSASFPRISPDGRFLVTTVADFGTFPIWHREADLYLLDLQSGESEVMEVNSEETDSYHTWSSNGRWLVFSSRRLDGRSTRPYFTHIDADGVQGKEFALPQEDPTLYDRMLESFNVPELVSGRIRVDSRDFVDAADQQTLMARPGSPAADTIRPPSAPEGRPQNPGGPTHDR
jgi:Tol biopolymer transport system component